MPKNFHYLPPKGKPKPQFDVLTKKRDNRKRRDLWATDDEFLAVNVYLDKIRNAEKEGRRLDFKIGDVVIPIKEMDLGKMEVRIIADTLRRIEAGEYVAPPETLAEMKKSMKAILDGDYDILKDEDLD